MKFTEGYWLPSEKANASHAMQAYEVEQIPGGMRILATTRPIEHRGMTLNLPTITVEFVAHTPDTISMEAWHYEAYDNKVPSFDKTESVYEYVTVTINDEFISKEDVPNTVVKDGDVVEFLYYMGGGAR